MKTLGIKRHLNLEVLSKIKIICLIFILIVALFICVIYLMPNAIVAKAAEEESLANKDDNNIVEDRKNLMLYVDDLIYKEYEICDGEYILLPTPSKDGYTFKYWYFLDSGVEIECTEQRFSTELSVTSETIIKLYAKWQLNNYSITLMNGEYQIDKLFYNILNENIILPNLQQEGASFLGWNYNGKIVCSVDSYTCKNILLYAVWGTNFGAKLNNSNNVRSGDSLLNYSSSSSNNLNSIYIVSADINKLTIIGKVNTTFANFRIEIAQRTTPITIQLENFKFQAQINNNGIYAQDATALTIVSVNNVLGLELNGNTTLNLILVGDNAIKAGSRTYSLNSELATPSKFCSGIVCNNIDFSGTGYVYIAGGNGIEGKLTNDGTTSDISYKSGKPGGCGLWASNVSISCGSIGIVGGSGGDGVNGIHGTHGDNGQGGSPNGKNGTSGTNAGNGGDGSLGMNIIRTLTINTNSIAHIEGGSGGIGGTGGSGGNGGDGCNGSLFIAAGVGGNGGNGGNAGRGGDGFAAYRSAVNLVCNGLLIPIDGHDGSNGTFGLGGTGGKGGKKMNGTYMANGTNGKNGSPVS